MPRSVIFSYNTPFVGEKMLIYYTSEKSICQENEWNTEQKNPPAASWRKGGNTKKCLPDHFSEWLCSLYIIPGYQIAAAPFGENGYFNSSEPKVKSCCLTDS